MPTPRRRGGRAPLSLLADANSARPLPLGKWEAALSNVQQALCAAQAESMHQLASASPAQPDATPPAAQRPSPELRRRRSASAAQQGRRTPSMDGSDGESHSAETAALRDALRAAQRDAAAAWAAAAEREAERDALANALAGEPLDAPPPVPEEAPPGPPPATPAPPLDAQPLPGGASPAMGRSVQAELLRLERRRVAEAQAEAQALRASLARAETFLRDLRTAAAAARGGGAEGAVSGWEAPPPLPPPPPQQGAAAEKEAAARSWEVEPAPLLFAEPAASAPPAPSRAARALSRSRRLLHAG